MAADIDVTPGAGKTVATDEVTSKQHQLIKQGFGNSTSFTRASAGTGTSDAGTQRVTLATDIALPTGGNVIGAISNTNFAVNNFPAGFLAAQSGAWTVTANAGTGTFAISAAALPLPTGASTEATLSALNAKVTAVNTGAVVIASGTITTVSTVTAVTTVSTVTSLSQFAGNAINLGTGNTGTGTLRVVLATDQPQLTNKLLVTPDANSAVNISQMNGVAVTMGNGVAGTGVQRVAIASDNTAFTVNATSAGDVAAGSSDSGKPVKIGGVGRTTNPTAVTDGQRVDAIFDKLGKQVVVGAIRDLKGVQKTTITSSTSETTIITAVASTFLDLYGLIITNTSGSACNVTIKDATSGTTRLIIAVPAGDTRGFSLPVDSAIPQATVNNNWTATCSSSVASIEITALYVKNL